jgi:predicted KAP-like P-loop ATPase
MWSDNETKVDYIDYQHLITAVQTIANNTNLLPTSIGVFGDWGSGKSSLMKMISETYSGDEVMVINFNGWLFEGYEDAKTVLMAKIVDEIVKKRKPAGKAVKIAARLLRRIDYMKIAGTTVRYGAALAAFGPAGLGIASIADLAGKIKDTDYEAYVKGETPDHDETLRSNIQEFHNNFDQLIKETGVKKIVVLIDDLDRCSPDTVIGTLEAIKLFLFTSQTVFIIGADERLIKYAVRRRFPEIPGDNAEVGRDYLEKLIQFPIRIPPLNSVELTIYINLLFTSLHVDIGEFEFIREKVLARRNENQLDFVYGFENVNEFVNVVSEELKEALLVSAKITPVLAVGLNGNPRQSKRFLNTLLLRREIAKSKGQQLSLRILAKLMLLEYFRSETFKAFYEIQARNQGIIPDMDILELSSTQQKPNEDRESKPGKENLSAETEAYLQDPWLKSWFGSEPSLKKQNLQAYFYFSRDKLTVTSVNLQRMSPAAQEMFKKILSDSEVIRTKAYKDLKKLSPADASAIFEGLIDRINQEENHGGENPLLKRIFDVSGNRNELMSQLISYCDKLPEQNLPIAIATWLLSVVDDTEYATSGRKVVEKWSTSKSNTRLAKISTTKLKQKK